jgi:hypothetical protein
MINIQTLLKGGGTWECLHVDGMRYDFNNIKRHENFKIEYTVSCNFGFDV